MNDLNSKVALVTGSSKGIGAEIALQFAAKGAKLIINYCGNQKAANDVVKSITEQGGKAIALQADVSQHEEVSRMFQLGIAHYGNIDILVNNAGIMLNSLIVDSTEAIFDKQMNINVKGVFNCFQAAANILSDNGSIITISSSVTRTIYPKYGIYSATKAAVEQMSRVFGKEMGTGGINVNCVLPGPTETELFLKGKSKEMIDKLASNNAFNRLGKPEDIAQTVVFLASQEAKWISGQSIGINGGMV